MKKSFLYLSLIGIILILAAITNPPVEDHRAAVSEKIHHHLKDRLSETSEDSDDPWEKIGNSLGLTLGDALIGPLVKNLIHSNYYVVFSLTQADWEDESHVIGIGVFGQVLLSPKIDQKLEEIAKDQF